jgi:hypothetical protein
MTGVDYSSHLKPAIMLFFHPMWDSENQRLGMRACTKLGYNLREFGDFIGFCGVFLLLTVPIYLVVRCYSRHFLKHDLWLLLIPFVIGIIGRAFFEIGWRLAAKKQFHYDYDTRRARWIEAGGHERVFP